MIKPAKKQVSWERFQMISGLKAWFIFEYNLKKDSLTVWAPNALWLI